MNTTQKPAAVFRLVCFLVLGLSLGACTAQKLDKNGTNNIDLVRKTQRVIRTNCVGRVASDEIETVDKPEQWVTIAPNGGYQAMNSEFYNNTLADDADVITDRTTFLVQYHKRDWGMSVTDGINSIHYSFDACPDKTRTDCASSTYKRAEEGDLNLAVTYREEFISSVKTVPAGNCPTPTPSP